MDPITMAVIAAATNPENAKMIGKGLARTFGKDAKLYRQQIKADRRRLAADDFGLSEAQKNAQMAAAMRAQQAGAKDIEANLQRQQGATGFGRSAAGAQAQRDLASDLANNAAQARGQIEQMSTQLANEQKQQALARIKARAKENEERVAEAAAAGANAAQSVATGAANAGKALQGVPKDAGAGVYMQKLGETIAANNAQKYSTPTGYSGPGGGG